MATIKPRDRMMTPHMWSASGGAHHGGADSPLMPTPDPHRSLEPATAALNSDPAPNGNRASDKRAAEKNAIFTSMAAPTRYGASRRPNLPALAAAIGIAALAFSALVAGQAVVTKTKIEKLNVLSIETPPPPPPPPEPQIADHVPPPPITLPPTALPPPVDAPRIEAIISTQTPPPPAPVVVQNDRPLSNASTAPTAAPTAPPVENAGDMSSTMISATPPRYPQESRRLREQGVVLLRVVLGLDGRVSDIRVNKSSGHPRLDQAALSAVRHWRWSPTMRNGTPVIVQGLVEIPFILQEKP